MTALDFLANPTKYKPQPVYALVGDDDFLKRKSRELLARTLLGDADPELALSTFAGDRATFREVRAELDTLPFVGDRRVVAVEGADKFVSDCRAQLEGYLAKPSKVGTLIIDASKKALPATSKIAKALPTAAKIECESPTSNKLRDVQNWVRAWANQEHGKPIATAAADLLVDRVGPHLGQLDQELAKLAAGVEKPEIAAADVDRLVANSHEGDTFKILDAIADGRAADGFAVLGQLFRDGDDEMKILGGLAFQLRKLGQVAERVAAGDSLGQAMDAANVTKWPAARQGIERQLRHLGLRRARQIPDWLVEINLGLKGGSELPRRMQLELLLTKFARPRG